MKIRFIRLRNIKSYGEGADGTGVAVAFAPGINRIAGRNGHGKSTLIEALGYALFLADPVFEENFQVQTYFLRTGAKTGEIQVAFDHEGEAFRVIRALGNRNPVRDKVVALADGSLAAEGRMEVDAFLCRLFQVAEPVRLSELFTRLIGVKQGRLTWPFDTRPSEARRHFEPILEVEIFRQCFDQLKPVSDLFEQLASGVELQLEGVSQQIRDRADSPDQIRRLQESLAQDEQALAAARHDLTAAASAGRALEEAETAFRNAERNAAAANQVLALAEQSVRSTQESLTQSLQASAVLAESRVHHEAYAAAEADLTRLQVRHREKSSLEQERHRHDQRRVQSESAARAAREQAETFERLRLSKEAERAALLVETDSLQRHLTESGPAHEGRRATVAGALSAGQALRQWMERVDLSNQRHRDRLTSWIADCQEIQAASPHEAAQARNLENTLANRLRDLERAAAAVQEGTRTLAVQLKEIAGGLCPFLKERCRQFDPARVQADLSSRDAEIARLDHELAILRAQHSEARQATHALVQRDSRLLQLRHSVESRALEIGREFEDLWSPAMPEHLAALQSFLDLSAPLPSVAPPRSLDFAVPPSPDPDAWHPPIDPERLHRAQDRLARAAHACVEAFSEPLASAAREWTQVDAERTRRQQDAAHGAQRLRDLAAEITTLAQQQQTQTRSALELESATNLIAEQIAQLDSRLQPLANLETEMTQCQETRQRHAEGHQRFLGAKALADLQPQCEERVRSALTSRDEASTRAAHSLAALESTRRVHDPVALAASRTRITELTAVGRAHETRLEASRQELVRELTRSRELEQALSRRATLETEHGRSMAARQLTEKARLILRDAAPGVAQRICDRIALHARQIFNRIHHDATEISWNAAQYSLRIDPGDRRFAMLSGGEQTKLALALTLAMVQQLTRLRFCIFDEPTYGVDADSRRRLADAIIELQSAVRFDQLLLVSHDDAFDDRIEHVVHLAKSASDGTRVLETP